MSEQPKFAKGGYRVSACTHRSLHWILSRFRQRTDWKSDLVHQAFVRRPAPGLHDQHWVDGRPMKVVGEWRSARFSMSGVFLQFDGDVILLKEYEELSTSLWALLTHFMEPEFIEAYQVLPRHVRWTWGLHGLAWNAGPSILHAETSYQRASTLLSELSSKKGNQRSQVVAPQRMSFAEFILRKAAQCTNAWTSTLRPGVFEASAFALEHFLSQVEIDHDEAQKPAELRRQRSPGSVVLSPREKKVFCYIRDHPGEQSKQIARGLGRRFTDGVVRDVIWSLRQRNIAVECRKGVGFFID